MANSKFDPSLLKPIDEPSALPDQNSQFLSQLQPLSDDQGDIDNSADDYFNNMPAPEGFFSKLPRNILIGLANLGHTSLNTPHDLAQSFESSGKKFDEKMSKALPSMPKYENLNISDYIPSQQDYNFAELLGQQGEGTLMDKLLQKGVEYAPELIGGRGVIRAGARRLKGTHQLDAVRDAVNELGFNNFQFSPRTVAEARRYLPNTEAVRNMIRASQGGNYSSSMSMQSQLGQHQRNLATSMSAAERLLAPRVGDLKQSMLRQIDATLRSNGMHVEADMLRQGINNYRRYQQVKSVLLPAFKYVGIPTTALALLDFGYKKGKKILSSD